MSRANFIYILALFFLVLVDVGAAADSITDSESDDQGCGCGTVPREGNPDNTANAESIISSLGQIERSLSNVEEDMVLIPGGLSYLGADKPVIIRDGEGPRRKVHLSPFYIDRYEVSNKDFGRFIESTGFITENERFGWSFVFHTAIPPHIKKDIQQAVLGAEWWLPVNGSTWREPEGPGSDVFATSRSDHPVVQVTYSDAVKFCEWRNARLPTEAEWEAAASGPERRSKRKVPSFPWGNDLVPKGTHRMNIFQGTFPTENTMDDGYEYTAPVSAYGEQNGYGVYNMLGNVWEWVQDWWTIDHAFQEEPSKEVLYDPTGPAEGREKVKKGGSFLCHRSYCYRYRLGSRFQSTPDSAGSNIGFRCARTADQRTNTDGEGPSAEL